MHNRASIELKFLARPPRGGWFYFWYDENGVRRRKRFGTGKGKGDTASREKAVDKCLIWLWARELEDLDKKIKASIEAGVNRQVVKLSGESIEVTESEEPSIQNLSDARVKLEAVGLTVADVIGYQGKRFSDNIKTIESARPTPFDELVGKFQNNFGDIEAYLAGKSNCFTWPALLIRGKRASYVLDLVGFTGLNLETDFDTLVAAEDLMKLAELFLAKLPGKLQRPMIKLLSKWLGVEVPCIAKDYPRAWQDILACWPAITGNWANMYDQLHDCGIIKYSQ